MTRAPQDNPTTELQNDRGQLELLYLKQQVEKMTLEIAELKATSPIDRILSRYLPVVASLLAVLGFWFSVYEHHARETEAAQEREQALKERTESLRREVARPFWDTQLKLYLAASHAAATIATSSDEAVRNKAAAQFWELYWGPLACVEDIGIKDKNEAAEKNKVTQEAVETAMVNFGKQLEQNPQIADPKLQRLSLDLAHAIRNVIGPSFELPTPESKDERTKSQSQ